MNISYNWLKRYIDTDLGAEEVARILTDIGLEVEGFEKIETIKGGLAGVVVGEVLTCEDHPDSDHLHVTTVDVGTGEPLQIVCGAPNCRAGLKVLCATVGTVLYPGGGDEEFKIKRSKIRGVESLGMLCAEDELGIGASHDGIMELPADAVAGTTARDYLRIEDDYLIEVGLTPNRVDAASHIGVARDLAAYLRSRGEDVSVKMPDVSAFAPDNHDLGVKIRVENHEAAPRYAGVTVKNCKIAPSPEWMQNCLRAAGINPKNNLVDITNFVLFELGQPLHAFDAAKIEGREVVVRTCAEGTPFVTLDGVERKLTADDLMICSAERPMCIAGVFGGLDSGISDTTTDVFIESAYFNPVWVRKTAKRFGLNTDSSFRFERGVDPNMQVYAAKRAALLMKELAGGEISSDITDIYPAPIEDFRFDVSFARIDALIGKHIPEETVRAILAALEVKVLDEKDGVLTGGETKLGLVSDDIIPNKVCLIPELLKTLPYKPFACSAIDALVHATESFLSPHRKTMTSELFSEKAMDLILKGFKLIDEKGQDARFEYLDQFVTASFYAGIAFLKAGCGPVHGMSFPLGGTYHVPHGESNYMLFGAIMDYYDEHKPDGEIMKFKELVSSILGCEVKDAIPEMNALLQRILPLRPLRDCGFTEADFKAFPLSVEANQQRLMTNAYYPFDLESEEAIYRKCY